MPALTPARGNWLVHAAWRAAVLVVVVGVVVGTGTGGCKKADRLLLLDVRVSGVLDASDASVRFSAAGWPTRTVASPLASQGLLFGYYGPPGDGAVTVTVEALDGSQCVLGGGTATVPGTAPGMTSPATVVFVRPFANSGCALTDAGLDATPPPDAGNDAAADSDDGGDASDASDAGAASDASDAGDATADGALDTGLDSVVSPPDANVDAAGGY